MFRKTALSLALAAGIAPTIAQAQSALATEGPWLVRARATYVQTDNGNSPVLGLGQVEVQSRWIPEFDISYFFTDLLERHLGKAAQLAAVQLPRAVPGAAARWRACRCAGAGRPARGRSGWPCPAA
jgi:outer membrane protein W